MTQFSLWTRALRTVTTLCAVVAALALCGCGEYGPPPPSVVERPAIPADAPADRVFEWSIDRQTVNYYWYKVNKYDVTIEARGYFPANYKQPADAVWQVNLHTIPTPDLPAVAGAYLGVLHSYVDNTGTKQFTIVPEVFVPELKDGIYCVIDSGVEFTEGEPKAIKAIRPVLHVRMVKKGEIDMYFDLPIFLRPKTPNELTPLPATGGEDSGPRGTPINVPTAPGKEEKLQSMPIPGMPGGN